MQGEKLYTARIEKTLLRIIAASRKDGIIILAVARDDYTGERRIRLKRALDVINAVAQKNAHGKPRRVKLKRSGQSLIIPVGIGKNDNFHKVTSKKLIHTDALQSVY